MGCLFKLFIYFPEIVLDDIIPAFIEALLPSHKLSEKALHRLELLVDFFVYFLYFCIFIGIILWCNENPTLVKIGKWSFFVSFGTLVVLTIWGIISVIKSIINKK